jgi:outer membrane protein
MSIHRPIVASLASALAAAAFLGFAVTAAAQDKIAYASLDLIVSLMPETKAMAKEIDTLGRKLAKDLEVKEQYAEKRAKEARDAASAGATDADLEKRRVELRGLQDELRRGAESADSTLASKRMDLLKPVFAKLEKTIEEVAKAEGYTFVLNATDGQGNSILLYGAEGRDLTEKILTKLGIPIPKKTEAPKPAKAGTGK